MKKLSLILLSAVALAGCNSDSATGDTVAQDAMATSSTDCTQIVSSIERLSCFDAEAKTPPTPLDQQQVAAPAAVESVMKAPDITLLVKENEAKRQPEQTATLLTRSVDDLPEQIKVVISAPALNGAAPHPYLAISCLSNISRLQLLTPEPLPVNLVSIRLLLDGRPISQTRRWQVLEDGTVTDAGRGLVAIEQLRHLARSGQQLQVESDQAPLDGLRFDVTELAGQMSKQREACHW